MKTFCRLFSIVTFTASIGLVAIANVLEILGKI